MSRKVPANQFDAAKREQLLDLLAEGCSQGVVAKKVGCSTSTVCQYSKRYAREVFERRAKAEGRAPESALDLAIGRTIEMAHTLLDELAAATKKQRIERFAQNATACAKLLKELNHVRQLRLGAPTSRSASDVTKTETIRVVEPIMGQTSDPLRILRNRLS